ncbi:MAG: alanine--tRNA ligase, partial [Myxococcales bacterium]
MLSHEIRRAFLEFFASKQHQVCPSAPLVPNDPTLMFVNAGMVPFKDVFTGKEKRDYRRATSSQKCIRISGKHNDLENVGVTARHHTFFEMLGNFSFGDYFKKDAIAYAWELFTKVLPIEQSRLIITVFGGEDGLAADDEARALWKEVSGLGDDRIKGMGKADNFWSMGDTGPCGPCSEIHYWLGPIPEGGIPYDRFGEEPDADGNGWFEIWNLVFMQFDRQKKGDTFVLEPLPAPSIDTGAGLERMACVLQGVTSNYDTDLLSGLVQRAAEISGKTYTRSQSPDDVSMRVIADHARLTAMMISEGIFPDNNGRSYVLRRVMRRAVRHGYRLGIKQPFLHEVALKVVDLMGDAYPQLRERRELIASITEQEETRFRETLRNGVGRLEEQFTSLRSLGAEQLPVEFVATLKDTYGFPIDLTRVIAEENGFEVDEKKAEEHIKELQGPRGKGPIKPGEGTDKSYYDALERVEGKTVHFGGYDTELGEGRVVALLVDGKLVDEVAWEGGEGRPGLPDVDIVTDRTPFY